ncbi:YceI family protein [Rummeliibacillus sp. POC4]|uniref:YceI family protein n=1 Tax=Rummeliibacillus sp. POC4 TaxID=2305899 RepID=UPI000E6683CE|nr:YceI family protein [Rummeliibacillus sp. POC4]RIJ64396.1 polyisoprenoid-binding protein [Rummeliibacillus sp. POC4]
MTKFNVDVAHSSLGFEVKHMMISKVKGGFDTFTADIDMNPEDLTSASIKFDIDVNSINSNNADRDNHLKSADFFDAEQFPKMTFVATDIKSEGAGEYKLTGDFTVKGVTKSVTFDVEYGGKGTNPWGVEVVAFEATGKINRKEFGLTWNAALETGGVLVGEDIKIKIELELNPAQ